MTGSRREIHLTRAMIDPIFVEPATPGIGGSGASLIKPVANDEAIPQAAIDQRIVYRLLHGIDVVRWQPLNNQRHCLV